MSTEESKRLVGLLKLMYQTFKWDICYTDWDAYVKILDDLPFEATKEAFIEHAKGSTRFPDPTGIRNTVRFNEKLRLAGLAAH